MPLFSKHFADDAALADCQVRDSAHVTPGAVGDHVSKIQAALIILDEARIDAGELAGRRYGPSTAAAVLAYKQKRGIINRSYQTQADNIVGKMTITQLDREMAQRESQSERPGLCHCNEFPDDRSEQSVRGRRAALVGDAAPGVVLGTLTGTPKEQALVRVSEAKLWVAAARNFIRLRKAQILSGLPADSFKDSEERKALDTHFKLQQHPKPVDHLTLLGGVYSLISTSLNKASTVFIDDPTTTDFANAHLGGFFSPSDPALGKIRFGPAYAGKGRFFQTSVIVHECAHWVNFVIDHFASELPPMAGTPVNSSTGVVHTRNYVQLSHQEAAGNAYTYAQFALHAFMGFDKRLFPNPLSQ